MKFTTGEVFAKNQANYWLYGFDDEYGERSLMKEAVSVAVNRMQDKRIWEKTYELSSRYNITGDVMERSNLIDNDKNRWSLLWHQLYWLSKPNSPESTAPAFPNIHIYAGYEEPKEGVQDWAGRAYTDLVTIKSGDDGVYQIGEFKIEINRYYTMQKSYQDAESWAGTIVHELLHNLGHIHENGYEIKYQINVIGDLVENDGNGGIRPTIQRKGKEYKRLPKCNHSNPAKHQLSSNLIKPKETMITKR